jgi:hypothetical protein
VFAAGDGRRRAYAGSRSRPTGPSARLNVCDATNKDAFMASLLAMTLSRSQGSQRFGVYLVAVCFSSVTSAA